MHDIAAMAHNTFSLASRTNVWLVRRYTEAPTLTLAACQWLVHAHYSPRCLLDVREGDVPGGPLGARSMRFLFLLRPAGCYETDTARLDIAGKVTTARSLFAKPLTMALQGGLGSDVPQREGVRKSSRRLFVK
jgi:hypothetical protein